MTSTKVVVGLVCMYNQSLSSTVVGRRRRHRFLFCPSSCKRAILPALDCLSIHESRNNGPFDDRCTQISIGTGLTTTKLGLVFRCSSNYTHYRHLTTRGVPTVVCQSKSMHVYGINYNLRAPTSCLNALDLLHWTFVGDVFKCFCLLVGSNTNPYNLGR